MINKCFMKGQHVYNHNMNVGDTYECTPEPNNVQDPRAIAVKGSSEQVIGHVPSNLCDSVRELFDRLPGKLQMFW